MLYCIVGPSGCGKSSIVEKLNELGYKSPDSYTTRPKRYENEKGHTFITDEEYDKLENIVAYTVFNDYRYCVTESMLKDCTLYVVDPEGVRNLAKYKNHIDFKVIGLSLSRKECKNRMLARGDSLEDVEKRMANDELMFSNYLSICNYVLDATSTIDEMVQKVLTIIE